MFKIKLHGGKTAEVEESLFWHSTSHILAQAVKRLFPDAKVTIGPSIEEGFYYDFDVEKPFSEEDLTKIEEEMKNIIKEKLDIEFNSENDFINFSSVGKELIVEPTKYKYYFKQVKSYKRKQPCLW